MNNQDRRVFWIGARTAELRELRALGVNVVTVVHNAKRGEKSRDLGVESYNYFNVHSGNAALSKHTLPLPENMKNPLFFAAFDTFRRHYHRTSIVPYKILRSWVHLDNVFFLSAQFYYDILLRNRVTTIIFSVVPHEGTFIILYHLAKMMGLETIITLQTNFTERMWISRSIEDIGVFDSVQGEGLPLPTPDTPTVPFYMQQSDKWKRLAITMEKVVRESVKRVLNLLTLRPLWNPMGAQRNLVRLIHALDRFRVGVPSLGDVVEVDMDVPFIYFPLHLQPEMTTDTLGLLFGDQLRCLEALSAAVPDDTLIYAKENPLQTTYMREESFFHRLRNLSNVRYVSTQVPSFELISKCRALATVTGTAGWEAALMLKGVVCFGRAWFLPLPGVFAWEGPETLAKAMEFEGDRQSLEQAFDALSRKTYRGVVDYDYAAIVENFDAGKAARDVARSLVVAMLERPLPDHLDARTISPDPPSPALPS